MYHTLTTLIDRLDSPAISDTGVIRWGAPVLSFGDLAHAAVATVGLNPSNREFMDDRGVELQGIYRRFHTLNSLGLQSWSDSEADHLRLILDSCRTYFLGNPYDRRFKRLDLILSSCGISYYGTAGSSACHLDLIPYATTRKWTELSGRQRSRLLALCSDTLALVLSDTLALVLRDSPIRLLILNGKGVVDRFQEMTAVRLERHCMPKWTLKRRSNPSVTGFAYKGIVTFRLCGIRLPHPIMVLGYNHNIQSSFGVTTEATAAIRAWIAEAREEFDEATRSTIG